MIFVSSLTVLILGKIFDDFSDLIFSVYPMLLWSLNEIICVYKEALCITAGILFTSGTFSRILKKKGMYFCLLCSNRLSYISISILKGFIASLNLFVRPAFPIKFQKLFPLESELVIHLCTILCDPMDCSPPGSSTHGVLQLRILEEVAISFSRGPSQPRDRTQVSCIIGRFFTIWATKAAIKRFIALVF